MIYNIVMFHVVALQPISIHMRKWSHKLIIEVEIPAT